MTKFFSTPIPDEKVIRLCRHLAREKHKELQQNELDSYESIVTYYDLKLKFGQLSTSGEGALIDKVIVIDPLCSEERRNFTFYHELMHYYIRGDDDLLSLIHESAAASDMNLLDQFIERLCNIGASELLIPSGEIRNFTRRYGFTTKHIPTFCEQYNASAIAVAIQMISTAAHRCYLFIAELDAANKLQTKYVAESPAAKYPMSRQAVIPRNHLMYKVTKQSKQVLEGLDKIPLRSGKNWYADCSSIYFRDRVYCIFNTSAPQTQKQLRMFF